MPSFVLMMVDSVSRRMLLVCRAHSNSASCKVTHALACQSQGSRLCKCSVLLHSIHFICRRGEEVQRGVAALQREREALEAGVLDMAGKTVALDRWLADNEAKIPEGRHAAAHLVVLTKLWSCCIMRMLADGL